MLNEEASRTFIAEDIVKQPYIYPTSRRTEKINLSTFGTSYTQMRNNDVVDIQLETIDGGTLKIAAFLYRRFYHLYETLFYKLFCVIITIRHFHYLNISRKITSKPKLWYLLSRLANLEDEINVCNAMIYKAIISSDHVFQYVSLYWDSNQWLYELYIINNIIKYYIKYTNFTE